MYHEDIFYPFLPMFSTFDGKMVNVVENAECFSRNQSSFFFSIPYQVRGEGRENQIIKIAFFCISSPGRTLSWTDGH